MSTLYWIIEEQIVNIHIHIYTYLYLYLNICIHISISRPIYLSIYLSIHTYSLKHQLRGIELVRTIISQLVLAVAFFKGIFWNFEFDKNYMTSNMFCFTMMSLMISRYHYIYMCVCVYNIYIYIYIHTYIYILYIYIYILLLLGLIGRDYGLSTLCHNCGFSCQQRVPKTFPGPGYLHSDDRVVWLWYLLVNLCIYILSKTFYQKIFWCIL